MKTRRPRWPLCSRLSPRTGRRLRKKCHSWCRLLRFFPCPVVISLIHIFAVRSSPAVLLFLFPLPFLPLSQSRIYTNPRGTGSGGGRGGKPFNPHHQQAERPLPPSYVCYRCGQKGMSCTLRLTTEGVSDLRCVCEAIGFKIVQRIVIVSSTINHA